MCRGSIAKINRLARRPSPTTKKLNKHSSRLASLNVVMKLAKATTDVAPSHPCFLSSVIFTKPCMQWRRRFGFGSTRLPHWARASCKRPWKKFCGASSWNWRGIMQRFRKYRKVAAVTINPSRAATATKGRSHRRSQRFLDRIAHPLQITVTAKDTLCLEFGEGPKIFC